MAMRLVNILAVAAGLAGLAASSSPELSVRTYNAPGMSEADTHMAIRRDLEIASLEKRKDLKGNTTLDRSWNGAVLLKFGTSQTISTKNKNASAGAEQSVEIVCTSCYIKGFATAELKIPDNFNATTALNRTVSAVRNKVVNFTESIEDYMENYFTGVVGKFDNGIDLEDFAFPQLNYNFTMEIPTIPEATLKFGFDGMEMYLQTSTILSAALTYELNLYASNTPIGISIGKDSQLGVVFKVDLLLKSEGTINISTGLHIKLDDGVKIDITLFGDKISNIVFNGAQFEFLPVTVESAGVVLSAILRIGIHAGIAIKTPSTPQVTVFNHTIGFPELKGGIEVGVFANIAEFVTNVTAAPGDKECHLKVVQEYKMALGANAGASVALGTDTWGPVATTSTAIFSKQMASVCAVQGKSTPAAASASPTGKAAKRQQQDMTTTTTKITVKHTGVQCISAVAGNCPMSLQTTTQSTETVTLTASAPKGQKPTFPSSVQDRVTSTATFGKNVVKMKATSGVPSSYTPGPTDKAKEDVKNALDGKVGGVSKKVVVGVCLGVGLPLLAGILAAFVIMRRRKRYAAVPAGSAAVVSDPYGGGHDGFHKQPVVSVSEFRR